jgi:hypothetical protein
MLVMRRVLPFETCLNGTKGERPSFDMQLRFHLMTRSRRGRAQEMWSVGCMRDVKDKKIHFSYEDTLRSMVFATLVYRITRCQYHAMPSTLHSHSGGQSRQEVGGLRIRGGRLHRSKAVGRLCHAYAVLRIRFCCLQTLVPRKLCSSLSHTFAWEVLDLCSIRSSYTMYRIDSLYRGRHSSSTCGRLQVSLP